jgi:protein MpaA
VIARSVSLVLSLSVAVGTLAACNGDEASTDDITPTTLTGSGDDVAASTGALFTPATDPGGSPTSTGPTPSSTAATSSTTTSSTTTTTSTTSTTTTTELPIPEISGPLDLTAGVVGLGRSAGGRPIVAERLGETGGRRMLVIGVIHGNEDDGVAIVERLRESEIPDGVELWVIESMNPDGQVAQDRHNGNEVDLNRNFPYNWGPIGLPGDPQYAGTGPASEPETKAMVNFIGQLQPDVAIWYHQDLYVINPSSGREGAIRQRYAELTGLPMGQITGGTYTGIAATWARHELAPDAGVAFIVELGPTLTPGEADTHTAAVLTIATDPL